MKMKEVTLDKQVGTDLENVQKIIRDSYIVLNPEDPKTKTTFYEAVLDKLSDKTRNTPEQIQYLEAYEMAVSVFRAAAYTLREQMDVLTLEHRLETQRIALEDLRAKRQGPVSERTLKADEKKYHALEELQSQITDAVFFSNRYALFFAGQVGLQLLNSEKKDVQNLFAFGPEHDDSQDTDFLAKTLAQYAIDGFLKISTDTAQRQQKPSEKELKDTLACVFSSWVNQFAWPTFKDIAQDRGVEDLVLKFDNYSIKGGEFSRKYNVVVVEGDIMPNIKKEDVLGGQGFADLLWDEFMKLACFDNERKKNPFDPASAVFTFGVPGGGKTFTAHAMINSFADFCRENNIPLWAFTHNVTDYASEYQNATSNALAAMGKKIKEFQGIVVMYSADVDTILGSRKGNMTQEQKNTMGVYFKLWDGTLVPKNGRFLSVLDANYVEDIDDATKSRVFDRILELKRFDKPEHFAELVKKSTTKGLGTTVMPDSEWLEIGKYLLSCPLNNREIGNIVKQFRDIGRIPKDVIVAGFEAKEQYRNDKLRAQITRPAVIGKFQEYIETRMDIERRSEEERKKKNSDKFLDYLTQEFDPTKAAALSK